MQLSDVLVRTPKIAEGATEVALKAELGGLIERVLPRRAKKRRWPVQNPEVLRRIVYDTAMGARWETIVQPPAMRNMSRAQVICCLSVAEAMRDGELSVDLLLRRSNIMRADAS
jgi:hypothetical protein